MNDTWDITQDGQKDVDKEVCVATSLKENTNRWEKDGKNDLDDIAVTSSSEIGTGSGEVNLRSCERHLD